MNFVFRRAEKGEMYTEMFTDLFEVMYEYDMVSATIVDIYEEMLIDLRLPYDFEIVKRYVYNGEEVTKIKMVTEKTVLDIEFDQKEIGCIKVYYKLENKMDLEQLNEEYKVILQELKIRKELVNMYNYKQSWEEKREERELENGKR